VVGFRRPPGVETKEKDTGCNTGEREQHEHKNAKENRLEYPPSLNVRNDHAKGRG